MKSIMSVAQSNTDDVANMLLSLFKDSSVRPKTLFRDLQFISSFVPPSVLDKTEVQRQSVLFEIIKSERDYVRDLELIQDVFVDPLLNTCPVPPGRTGGE